MLDIPYGEKKWKLSAPECSDIFKKYDILGFVEECYDTLHFVAANRDRELFPALLRKFASTDIISGKIANDQTARTFQAYLAGLYGTPGEVQADEMAIRLLLPNRLNDQFCFRTEDAVGALEFVGSVKYGDRNRASY